MVAATPACVAHVEHAAAPKNTELRSRSRRAPANEVSSTQPIELPVATPTPTSTHTTLRASTRRRQPVLTDAEMREAFDEESSPEPASPAKRSHSRRRGRHGESRNEDAAQLEPWSGDSTLGYAQSNARPSFTYAELIREAIVNSPQRGLSLRDIYNAIRVRYGYYRNVMTANRFEAQVRHNLSLHMCFTRENKATSLDLDSSLARTRGRLWRVDDAISINQTTRGPRPQHKRGKARKRPERPQHACKSPVLAGNDSTDATETASPSPSPGPSESPAPASPLPRRVGRPRSASSEAAAAPVKKSAGGVAKRRAPPGSKEAAVLAIPNTFMLPSLTEAAIATPHVNITPPPRRGNTLASRRASVASAASTMSGTDADHDAWEAEISTLMSGSDVDMPEDGDALAVLDTAAVGMALAEASGGDDDCVEPMAMEEGAGDDAEPLAMLMDAASHFELFPTLEQATHADFPAPTHAVDPSRAVAMGAMNPAVELFHSPAYGHVTAPAGAAGDVYAVALEDMAPAAQAAVTTSTAMQYAPAGNVVGHYPQERAVPVQFPIPPRPPSTCGKLAAGVGSSLAHWATMPRLEPAMESDS
eukprot:Opistho-1_new@32088